MSRRISDERLAELIGDDEARCEDFDYDVACLEALKELQQSRALVAELRALAERWSGQTHALDICAAQLRSLLSAHAPSHIQAVAAQATREGIIGIDFDAKAQPAPYKHCPECGEHLSMHKIPCGAAQTEKDAEGAR